MLADRLTSPLTDPADDQPAARFGRLLRRRDADCAKRCALALKRVADMPRALTRLALNRGGPRDLGALRSGFSAAGEIAALFAGVPLPDELAAALKAIAALPREFAGHLEQALADELPLLKRDGGFVREGYDRELDELRGLATESRRVILGLERGLIEETGIRSLKIRHNNVLGYYIEVTANHQAIMNGTDEAKGRFIHRQTMANAMRFTTTELAELESKIANAADRALSIELAVFDRLVAEAVASADAIRAGAEALAVLDVSAALACLAAAEDYARPAGRRQPRLRDRGRATSGGRAGAEKAGGSALRRQRLRPVAGERREERRDLAAHRTEHGRQVDLPAPERADRDPRADGRLRAGALAPISASSTGCFRASARRTIWRAGARPSWSRWSRRRRSSTRRASGRWSSSTRSAAAPRPSTACRSPGRRSNICTSKTAPGRSSPRISTR